MSGRKRIRRRPRTLLEWREAAQLSQRDAARLIGVSQAGYWKFEQGLRHPRPATLARIVKLTGVPVEVLAGIA